MFAAIAPKLRDNGWLSLIPIVENEKRPAIAGWEQFNRRAPLDDEIERWCRIFPNSGIGLAAGPDSLIGIDLDFKDPAIAAEAARLTRRLIGGTPLIRIGLPPKRLLIYRADPYLRVDGKAFGGFELFIKSGQVVLYGIHPVTRRPYAWPDASPEDVAPGDLPSVGTRAVTSLIESLLKLAGTGAQMPARRSSPSSTTMPNTAAGLLPVLRASATPLEDAATILSTTARGARHNTMMGLVVGLVTLGKSDTEISDTLRQIYVNAMSDVHNPGKVFAHALKWSRTRIGDDDETVSRDTAAMIGGIADSWNRKWGRP